MNSVSNFSRVNYLRYALLIIELFATYLCFSCSGEIRPNEPEQSHADTLRSHFAAQAALILEQSDGFHRHAGGFSPSEPEDNRWTRTRMTLPHRGDDWIRMRGFGGAEIRINEVDNIGAGAIVQRSVAYDQPDRTSYWVAMGSTIEEWLLIKNGSTTENRAIATWLIEGSTPRQRGEVVDLVDDAGVVQLSVTAPRAYSATGKPLRASLEANAQSIELKVEACDEIILVDPAWTAVAPMSTPRIYHAAISISGKVLVIGGSTDSNGQLRLATAEQYDPTSNTWTNVASMSQPRSDFSAIKLANGKILAAGGRFDGGSAEIYDPANNGWVNAGTMIGGDRFASPANALANGDIVLAGGAFGIGIATTELYHQFAGTWAQAASMSVARRWHSATLLNDGRIFAAGGYTNDVVGYASTEIYNSLANTWAPAAPMPSARVGHTATLLSNGKVLIAGGQTNGQFVFNSILYDPSTNSMSQPIPLIGVHSRHTATVLGNGTVFITGNGSAELYDPSLNTWSATSAPAINRREHRAALLANGKVLIIGGIDAQGGAPTSSCELFGQLAVGSSCSKSGDCATQICADGVCCNAPCAGACMACSAAKKGGGADGVCGNVAGGTDPDNECISQAASTCGLTGFCNGGGFCQLHPNGTTCVASSCAGTILTKADICNGNGTCVDSGTQDCTPYACSGGACLSNCANDAQCAPTAYCSGSTCIPKKLGGTVCAAANQCQSTFCVDGVCCNNACSGVCSACSAAKKGSGADGTCGTIAAGADPDNECVDQGLATCGSNGFCDGLGTCQKYANGSVCTAASCNGTILTKADLCNGTGTCVDNGTQECAPFACNAGVCLPSCVNDAQCAPAAYCNNPTCVAKAAIGGLCSAASQCLSGFCVDGVCCNNACSGTCVACSAAKKGSGADGACGNIAVGTNPDSDCVDQDIASCGTVASCDGSGACKKHDSGVVCADAFCAGTILSNADICDGAGTCVDKGTKDCAPFTCGNKSCVVACSSDLQCAPNAYCSSPNCIFKAAPGATCSVSNECQSGVCADGVCCDAACSGPCVACSAAKKGSGIDGICGNILVNTDPDSECTDQTAASCGTSGNCDGSGACQKYAVGTVCVNAACSGATLNHQDLCDGNGACVDGGSQDCGFFLCSDNACPTTCADDSGCAASAFCEDTVCTGKQDAGASCTGNNQCASNFCVDGVCCESECKGACMACSKAEKGTEKDGTCGPVEPGAPDDACVSGDPAVCGALDGTCGELGACHKNTNACDGGINEDAGGTDGGINEDAGETPSSTSSTSSGGQPEVSYYSCNCSTPAPTSPWPGTTALGGLLALAARSRKRATTSLRGQARQRIIHSSDA